MIKVTEEMVDSASNVIFSYTGLSDAVITEALQASIEASEEIQDLAKAKEWQPIDTAPEQILVMVWQKYNNEWGIWWGHKVANDWFVKFGNEWLQSQPTHWRPLPQPPKEL